jgi:hypothetical protein
MAVTFSKTAATPLPVAGTPSTPATGIVVNPPPATWVPPRVSSMRCCIGLNDPPAGGTVGRREVAQHIDGHIQGPAPADVDAHLPGRVPVRARPETVVVVAGKFIQLSGRIVPVG